MDLMFVKCDSVMNIENTPKHSQCESTLVYNNCNWNTCTDFNINSHHQSTCSVYQDYIKSWQIFAKSTTCKSIVLITKKWKNGISCEYLKSRVKIEEQYFSLQA